MKKNFSKILAFSLTVLTATASLASCGSESNSSSANASNKKGTLTVGTGADWDPYLFMDDDGNLVGFDIDVVNAVADKLGYDVQYDITEFDKVFGGLEAGKYDLIAWEIGYTDERAEKYVYSNTPYSSQDAYLIVAAGSDINDISELHDVHANAGNAASTWGQYWINYVDEHPEKNITLDFLSGTPYDEVNIEAMQNGTIAAVINNKVSINKVNESYGEVYKIAGDPLISDNTYHVFKKGNEALRDEWDSAVQELIDDGTIAELRDKWGV